MLVIFLFPSKKFYFYHRSYMFDGCKINVFLFFLTPEYFVGGPILKVGLFGTQSPNQVYNIICTRVFFIFKISRRRETALTVIEIQRCVEEVGVDYLQASTIFEQYYNIPHRFFDELRRYL